MSIKKNVLWNLFGSAAPLLVGVVAIPYIYKEIGIERIGVLTIIWALIGYFSIFDFGLGRAITQRIASLEAHESNGQKRTIATTGVFLTLLIGTIGGLIGVAAIELVGVGWISSAQHFEREIHTSFLLACLAIPATTATAGLRGILEGEQRFKAINLLKLFLGLTNFLGPIASILCFGPRLDFTVGSLVIARYVICFAHYFSARQFVSSATNNLSHKESKQLFQFGGWMTLSNIISPLMVVADRFFIGNIIGAGAVAFYTIPVDFIFRLLIIPAAISTALFPVFAQNKNNYFIIKAHYNKSIKIIFAMMSSITLFIVFFGEAALALWLGPEFAQNSFEVAVIISIGVIFTSLAQIPYAYIQATGDAKSTTLIHLVELIIYVPIFLYLVHQNGITGAATAWSLRAALDLALLHFWANNIKSKKRTFQYESQSAAAGEQNG
jgi:O-antigen/teichoic acid export membrane protein